MRFSIHTLSVTMLALALWPSQGIAQQSVARQWNEEMLDAIRIDYPAPTVHSRNLFNTSAAMYDAWAAYAGIETQYRHEEKTTAVDVAAARDEAISYAAYGILSHRFTLSPGAATSLASFDAKMAALGYDTNVTTTAGNSPAALGNRIAESYINFGLTDGANEQNNYEDSNYTPVNSPMIVGLPGTTMNDPNRWQPLSLDFLILQNGIPIGTSTQTFLGSHWGGVTPFALTRNDPNDVYVDPGLPPQLGGAEDARFKQDILSVIRYSSQDDPDDPTMIDISPASIGNSTLGTNDGTGYAVNPVTGQPYVPQMVRRGDYGRVLAEFWADGPSSETPPGHWNTLFNYVSDHPLVVKTIGGTGAGPVLSDLEWDVKGYFAINGAVHDAAIAAWDAKAKYDYTRPISMIRYMGGLGQSSDPQGLSYHPDGLPLEAGLVEVITAASTAVGERHEGLAGHEGEIALYAWGGIPADPLTEYTGAEWIRAVEWVPYQRDTFVTPPFAGYVSGHSTFSRAAAEVLIAMTGDDYFPGGLGEFLAPQDDFLEFEIGPTASDITLQWATYYDAADEAGISRLWGGIHVAADDFEGRIMGSQIGIDAFDEASTYWVGVPEPSSAVLALAGLLALAAAAAVRRRRRA